MKKFIFFLILLLTTILVTPEVHAKEVTLNWIPNVYYNYKKDGLIYWGQMAYIKVSNNIAYCYEIENTVTTSTYDYETAGLMLYKDTAIIPYFGYGYNSNTTTLNYYLATQEMIWEELGYEVYFTTQSEGNGSIINVDNEKQVISIYVNNYKEKPTFNKELNFELGTTNTLIEMQGVLNRFNVINNTQNIISKENNKLTIKANVGGSNTFSLISEYNSRFSNVKYYREGSQTIIQIGTLDRKIYNYTYNVSYGNATINLIDKYTNTNINSGLSTFKNNVFELYNSNEELINTYKTDESGKININNLNIGKYKLKHVEISNGYTKEIDTYEFEIKNNTNEIINIYLKPITTILNIQKTFGNPLLNTVYYDDSVTFIIKDKEGNIINEITTDELGKCNITLNYGEYVISQKNTNHIDELSSDYVITINDFNKDINYLIFTPIYNSKIKVVLYEKNTNIPIKDVSFRIDDTKYITDDLGIFITDYYDIGNYILKEDDVLGYIKSNDIEFEINKDNIYVKDNNAYIDIIIYNEIIPNEEDILIDTKDELINNDDVLNDKASDILIDNKEANDIIINNSMIDAVKEDVIIDNDDIILESIEKLPNLGINASYIYMILIFIGYKNVKKNNN